MRRLSCFVVAALFAAGCSRDIVRDSAELDRALVPAVDLTSHGEAEVARAAVAELELAWSAFYPRYRDYRPEDPDWLEGLAMVDTLVSDVVDIVEVGDLPFAAKNLVDMRMLLAELRESAGISYLPDVLGELWEPVEELDALAGRRAEEEVLPGDQSTLSVLFDEFDALLQDLVDAEFDPVRLGFDEARTEAYFAGLDALADAGDELAQALTETELTHALAVARRLRALYFDVYRLFGDYALAPLDTASED